jgi:uncharacterized membrane protein YphA (DoxX/SURF4 family)
LGIRKFATRRYLIMASSTTSKILNYFIAAVWLANGLFCKVLNLVPRHQEIVASILGQEHTRVLTVAIGISEIGMAIWILSGYKSRINAIVQIVVIAVMNTMEFILVPGLLLWGRFNALFALLLILVIYYNEFHLKPKPSSHP